jgi:hypothetical protein
LHCLLYIRPISQKVNLKDYDLFTALANQFRNPLFMIFGSSGLGWSCFDRNAPLAEVAIREIQSHGSLKVFELFAESIGQPGKPTAVHSQGVVLLLDVTR